MCGRSTRSRVYENPGNPTRFCLLNSNIIECKQKLLVVLPCSVASINILRGQNGLFFRGETLIWGDHLKTISSKKRLIFNGCSTPKD